MHLPLRYEDETRILDIATLSPGRHAQLEGTVSDSRVQYRPRRQLTASLHDTTGRIGLRWLHFYPNQVRQLESGGRWRVLGEVRAGYHGLEMVHPRLKKADTPLPKHLTPIYPTVSGLSQPVLRKAVQSALERADLSDTLPDSVLEKWQLMPFSEAIHTLHAPEYAALEGDHLHAEHPALVRIKFDELLAQQLSLAAARAARHQQRAPSLPCTHSKLMQALLASLPFSLTAAQRRVVEEIAADLKQHHPMHRLLQGDVGSGKTIVAAAAAIQAISSGYQVALMAPTEILAQQHYDKLAQWLAPLDVKSVWLAGSQPQRERRANLESISQDRAQLIIGTQALIQEHVVFPRLGLVILDEQHRFGVGQRLALNRKGDQNEGLIAHQLHMSATPIPRTLAMTYMADLDVSIIDEMPPGRQPVLTKLVSNARRTQVVKHIQSALQQGRQAYWICPLVEESEALQLETAVDTHNMLSETLAPYAVGLVHGRLTPAEKNAVMQGFRAGDIQLLVATTVIEVGVDVPNASLMVIEHAERFGLAQLHQLRGRVGRGHVQSACVLLYEPPLSEVAKQRLRAMYETTDGFEIARQDLAIRGPGEFLGTRQSGQYPLRFAHPDDDAELVEQARKAALVLRQHHPANAKQHVQRWMRGKQDFLRS